MKELQCESFSVKIYMAGDYNIAKNLCGKYVFDHPSCINIVKTEYIYTGGQECGFIIEFINYPRFLSTLDGTLAKAQELAQILMVELNQNTFSIVTPMGTQFYSRKRE